VTQIGSSLNLCVRGDYAYTGFGSITTTASSSATGHQFAQAVFGANVYVGSTYAYSGYEYETRPTTRIAIDPNIRVRGNGTYAGFEDVTGPIKPGDEVEVYEPESGLVGQARVTEIDAARELVYLSVEWSSLTDEAEPTSEPPGTEPRPVFVADETAASWTGDAWMTLISRPCLAYVSFRGGTLSVLAPAFPGALPFPVPDLLASQGYSGSWRNWMVAA
jgi:hypothetical protein